MVSSLRVTVVAAVLLGLLVAVLSSAPSVHAVQVRRGAAEPQATATPAAAPTGAAASSAAPSNQTAAATPASGGAAASNQTASSESSSEAAGSSEASGSSSASGSASGSGSSEESSSASGSASASSEESASVHSTTETREETYSLKTNAIGEQVSSSEPKIDETLEDSVPRHEGSTEHGADDVAVTLARLGTVLNKMFVQVENDEHMFKVFKDKVLEDEVSKSDVDLSWPAVKDLVRSEVRLGRQKIENEVNNFKVELLDVVQRGLGDLRASLRATITTGFIAPSESLAHAAAAAASEESSEASSEESSAASSVNVQLKKGASIDADAAAEPAKDAAAPGDAPNADVEGDDMVTNKDAYEGVASPLDAVSRALGTHMDAKDVLEVRQLVLEKLAQHEQKDLAAKKAAPQAAALGASADDALADLRRELAGKDLKGEVASKIEAVRHDAAATKSEATSEALRRLETSLGGESSAATVPTGNELLDRLQHRLDGLLARTQRIQQDRADVDAAAAAAAPVAGAASAASNPFIVEAVDVTHGEAAGDGRVEADLKTSGVTPAIKEEGVKVEFAN